MQVVVPSVSLAAVLQGTALTVFVEIPSSATLVKPTSLVMEMGPPPVGAARTGAPTGGGEPIGGGDATDGGEPADGVESTFGACGVCCARTADELSASDIAKERVAIRIEPSFKSVAV